MYISVLILFMIMPQLIINTCVSLMYELKKNGKVFTSKFVVTGPSSYEKRIYRAAVSQRLRNTDVEYLGVARHSSNSNVDVKCRLILPRYIQNSICKIRKKEITQVGVRAYYLNGLQSGSV